MHALTWGRPILSALLRVHIPPASEGGFAPSDFDVIEDHPEATALRVEGLDQDSFEMLVDRYGERFSALGLWKCPRIEDLTPLETMTKLTHVVVFWNQRATRLWNLTATPALTGLHLTDFKRLRSLDDLADGRGLEELEIGDMPGSSGFVVESLEPLANLTELRFLSLVVRVADGRVQPLGALQRLKLLQSPINRWTTDQCAGSAPTSQLTVRAVCCRRSSSGRIHRATATFGLSASASHRSSRDRRCPPHRSLCRGIRRTGHPLQE